MICSKFLSFSVKQKQNKTAAAQTNVGTELIEPPCTAPIRVTVYLSVFLCFVLLEDTSNEHLSPSLGKAMSVPHQSDGRKSQLFTLSWLFNVFRYFILLEDTSNKHLSPSLGKDVCPPSEWQ